MYYKTVASSFNKERITKMFSAFISEETARASKIKIITGVTFFCGLYYKHCYALRDVIYVHNLQPLM